MLTVRRFTVQAPIVIPKGDQVRHATMTDVTVRIGDIVIDCREPRRAADFWCAALGYRITEVDDTGVAVAGASSAPTLLFLASADRKRHKNRIHFDVCPNAGSTRDEEVARLESLGATQIDVGQSGDRGS